MVLLHLAIQCNLVQSIPSRHLPHHETLSKAAQAVTDTGIPSPASLQPLYLVPSRCQQCMVAMSPAIEALLGSSEHPAYLRTPFGHLKTPFVPSDATWTCADEADLLPFAPTI